MLAASEVLKALTSLAWPILIGFLLFRLFPSIKKVIDSRSFALKFAGIEVSVQEATDQIKTQLQDLREQVVALRKATGQDNSEAVATRQIVVEQRARSVLWVDDTPSNNALEISQLETRGYRVFQATSTAEALSKLSSEPNISVIVSDMGRNESGDYVAQAGLAFLKAARSTEHRQPFIIYTTARNASKWGELVKASGGDGATASPVELFEWIDRNVTR